MSIKIIEQKGINDRIMKRINENKPKKISFMAMEKLERLVFGGQCQQH